jgi:hypothetical protein
MGQQDQTKPQGGMYDKSGQQGSGDLTGATDQGDSGQNSEPRMDQRPPDGSQAGGWQSGSGMGDTGQGNSGLGSQSGTGQSGQTQSGQTQSGSQPANQGSAGQMGSSPVTGQERSDQPDASQEPHDSTADPR